MDVTPVPVPVDTLAPQGETVAYLVGTDPAVLVDPAGRTDDLDAAVAEHSIEHLLVTHTHPDHVAGVAHYADSTGATVWARRGREHRFREATGVAPDRALGEGSTVPAGDGVLTALDTAGHAPDHLAFALGDGRYLTGDLAVAEGSVTVAAPEGDMRGYLTALRRLWARDPDELLPGHGPAIDAPRPTLERLIAHRLDRERRVLAAVEAGATALDAVLDAAYDKDLTGVREYARRTVACHLEKLAVEGRVAWDGERASPV